jgi:hypothetical protein
MAFGKKKQNEAAAAAAPEAALDPEPEEEQPVVEASESPAEAPPQEDASVAEPVPPETAEAAADPLGGDLLNMFQTTKIETEDLSVVLEFAGEVEMDDLLEELHTVALALGCQLEEVSDDEAARLAA